MYKRLTRRYSDKRRCSWLQGHSAPVNPHPRNDVVGEGYSRNFLESEFRSLDGKGKAARMNPVFITKLQANRDELGKSIVITLCYSL